MATGKSTPSPAILGIDLGTTNSLCAVFVDGAPCLVRNAHDSVLTPSVVAVLPGGEVLVGAPAKEVAVTQPERAVSCFKRWMGSDETVVLDGKPFSAAELSSLVLRSLRDDAARELGVVPTEAVVTVPAYFNDNQRRATKAAAEMAGLRVRRIVNEPTAAALAYGFHNRDRSQKLLVIDLGGGTFDVTLMDVFEGTLEIVATAGESQLGGEDFTNRLVAEALAEHGRQLEHVEMQEPLRVARLRQECEQAKRSLGTQESVVIRLPNAAGELSADAVQIDLTAARFADSAKPLLDRLFGPIDRVLRDAGLQADAVDELILVGGATRMPIVRRAIAERLGREPVASLDPDETVCLGAAVQAALIVDDRAVDDLVMTDVCPHTLGVDTSKQLGGDLRSGYYTPLIHRNTTIPVSREQVFETLRPNQREVQVVVYQGEHRRVENNLKLGELTVRGVPPGPAGQEVLIRFTYDINGILEVEAYAADADPKEKARVVLTHDAGDLDEDEVAAAVEKMRALKYYPREDQRNQFLLRRGERLLGEVSPLHRDQLETAIDALEAALAGSDRELVEAAAEGLLFTLSALGMDPNEGEAADGIEGDD